MSSPPRPIASRGLRFLNGLLLVVLLVVLGLQGVLLADYLLQSETYRFGTEVGGWVYRSRLHYLGSLLTELLVVTAGVVLSLMARGPVRVLSIRLLTLLLAGALIAAAALVH